MGSPALPQLLQSLCRDARWTYAVFWKIRRRVPAVLTWEDGYFDHSKARRNRENCSDEFYFNRSGELFPFVHENGLQNGSASQFPLGVVEADMACRHYSLGEGLVGEVAVTGNYCWLSSDDILASRCNSEIPLELPEEWLSQFLAGVKTTLLLPVLPHGVLQLGSLELVAEDIAIVADLTERLVSLQHDFSHSLTSTMNHGRQDLSILSCFTDGLDESLKITGSQVSKTKSEGLHNNFEANCSMLNLVHVRPLSEIQEDAWGNETSVLAASPSKVSSLPIGPANQSERMDDDDFGFSRAEAELHAFDKCYNSGRLGDFYDGMEDYFTASDFVSLPLGENDVENIENETIGNMSSFSVNYELDGAPERAFLWQSEFSVDTFFQDMDVLKSSSLTEKQDFADDNKPFTGESGRYPVKDEGEYLLESIISNIYGSPDHNSSNKSNLLVSSTVQPEQLFTSLRTKGESEESCLSGDIASCITPAAFSSRNRDRETSSDSLTSNKSMLSTVTDKEQRRRGSPHEQAKGQKMMISGSKRKGRPGDNQRPRPRDRQLIQERLKELRDLVPNGAKGSIDALLDRTIKHMLFLRGATNQAEKLKEWVPPEDSERNRWRALEINADSRGGASWALELGGELQVCPIVVEDLEYPGLMLIEMLCNDQGLFLDIAQVLRRLELTILKGVTEKDSGNNWARFIVEASKGFQRIDIFWPLMQLWQHRRNTVPT
ncbi:transcription factor bHLH155-like isoform X2 [Rhodamnia argentea]|uniref:Transcription factor bHLH155-like isoform X2 n=1 Tax=Rhodamnia argentea TaxID=178133 RepID=A0A8B8PBJ8_9MYRT|nr:transcription factor bHLH155-like isoform X2 [Rhodamnia argentea]